MNEDDLFQLDPEFADKCFLRNLFVNVIMLTVYTMLVSAVNV